MSKILAFDTETTGRWNQQVPFTDVSQPHLVQLGAILYDEETARNLATIDMLVEPDGWIISEEVSKVHGITHEMASKFGMLLANACYMFRNLAQKADIIIAHNIEFDRNIMTKAMHDAGLPEMPWNDRILRCTMKTATNIVKAPKTSGFGKGYKWPTLTETHMHFYGTGVVDAHTAMADAAACLNVHRKLVEIGAFK